MKKCMLLFSILALAAFAIGLVACGSDNEDKEADFGGMSPYCEACANAAPDPDSLEMDIPGEDENEKKVDVLTIGQLPIFYDMTVDISRVVNHYVLMHLGMLDEILSWPVTENADGYCVWGPWIENGLSPVETRFRMIKVEDNHFEYMWEQRPKNTEEEFQKVWYGEIFATVGTNRRGTGSMTIDYDTASLLDPTIDASGVVDVVYDTVTDGREIQVTFNDFDGEGTGVLTNGTYYYHNHLDNHGSFQYEYLDDIHKWMFLTNQPEAETVQVETLWQTDGAGISTSYIDGGDIGETAWFDGKTVDHVEALECWDSDFGRTYYRFQLYLQDGSDQALEEEGDEATCVY